MDDFRKFMNIALTAFVLLLVVWLGIVYVASCGFTLTCQQGQPLVPRTPVPTLAAATLPAPDFSVAASSVVRCRIAAVDLIGAWVSAGYSETEPFTFTDINGDNCEANFKNDVQPLFLESNIWYPGSLSCSSCHTPDLENTFMNMNLSTYEGILAGSQRANGEAQGKDILGGGDWEQSLLYQMLYAPNGTTTIDRPAMPLGRPMDVPAKGPVIFAGTAVQEEEQ
jgi:hypothetical protein